MRYKNHSNHIDILKEFYYANKYILTEQMKDTLIDAIECMEYIESNKALDNTDESPTREDMDDESSREKNDTTYHIKTRGGRRVLSLSSMWWKW